MSIEHPNQDRLCKHKTSLLESTAARHTFLGALISRSTGAESTDVIQVAGWVTGVGTGHNTGADTGETWVAGAGTGAGTGTGAGAGAGTGTGTGD